VKGASGEEAKWPGHAEEHVMARVYHLRKERLAYQEAGKMDTNVLGRYGRFCFWF
jgi:hypothetical protein